MSLGWMNLQEYLGANQGAADDMSRQLDEQQTAVDDSATQAATRNDPVSYSKFLAQRRQLAAQRKTEEGRAGMLGGGAADAFLAGRGQSNYSARPMASVADIDARRQADQQREADYWDAQKRRNAGLAQSAADEKRRQDESFAKARRALGQTPGYGRYSNAVGRSFDESRGRQVRVISKEESDEWTR